MELPVVFLLLMISSSLASGHTPDAQVFCGRKLSNALAILCQTGNVGKRSGIDVLQDYILESDWPWLVAKAKVLKGKREPGIVTECCDKPCTQDELMTYC